MTTIGLQYMLYATIFLATALMVEGVFLYVRDRHGARRRVNKRLELIDRGVDRAEVLSLLRRREQSTARFGPLAPLVLGLERKLSMAGVRISAPRFLALILAVTAAIFAAGLTTSLAVGRTSIAGVSLVIILFASAIGIGLPLMIISILRDRRLKKMEEQFPIALDVFVRGLRAGHPIASALELLTVEMPDPIGSEFGIVVDEVTYGLELRDALQNMADRLGLEDMHMFVVSVSIQGETGGNLAEILENLSRVIRERASMVLKVRALSSEGKMSGIMLSVLPVLAFCLVFMSRPDFFLDVAGEPAFFPSVFALIGLYVTGVLMIRRMINLKV